MNEELRAKFKDITIPSSKDYPLCSFDNETSILSNEDGSLDILGNPLKRPKKVILIGTRYLPLTLHLKSIPNVISEFKDYLHCFQKEFRTEKMYRKAAENYLATQGVQLLLLSLMSITQF